MIVVSVLHLYLFIDVHKVEEYNRCYCEVCSRKRGCSKWGLAGKKPSEKKFAVPIGWVKFGIK